MTKPMTCLKKAFDLIENEQQIADEITSLADRKIAIDSSIRGHMAAINELMQQRSGIERRLSELTITVIQFYQ